MMLRTGQQARDDPAHVIVEKRLKRTPAPVAVERNPAHDALGEQIAHHERHINSHTRAAVICFQSGKAIGADCRHHLAKRGFGLGARSGQPQASGPGHVAHHARQIGSGLRRAAQSRAQKRPLRIVLPAHRCPADRLGP